MSESSRLCHLYWFDVSPVQVYSVVGTKTPRGHRAVTKSSESRPNQPRSLVHYSCRHLHERGNSQPQPAPDYPPLSLLTFNSILYVEHEFLTNFNCALLRSLNKYTERVKYDVRVFMCSRAHSDRDVHYMLVGRNPRQAPRRPPTCRSPSPALQPVAGC